MFSTKLYLSLTKSTSAFSRFNEQHYGNMNSVLANEKIDILIKIRCALRDHVFDIWRSASTVATSNFVIISCCYSTQNFWLF